jgi:hypothetical protein
MSLTDVNPFTHVYSFDKAFPPPVMENLVSIYNNSRYLQNIVSYRKLNGLDFEICKDFSVSMTGKEIARIELHIVLLLYIFITLYI